ncbi:MAG: leucine-rich repeat domain-containing protein [Clostridiales bacterium]|nr:leucine-rich repeat domain-containing protein [Clostridiales bacterium]
MNNQYYKINASNVLYGLKPEFYTYLKEHNGTAPEIPEGVEMLGDNLFKNNKDLREIVTPASCYKFGWHTFLDCTNLSSLFIKGELQEIKGSAFSGCPNIEKLFIPESIISVRENAFKYCTGLRKVNFFDKLIIDNTKPEDNDEVGIRPFAHPNKIVERIDDNIIVKTKDNFYFKAPDREEFIRVPLTELRETLDDGYLFIKSMQVHRYYAFKEKYEELKEAGQKVFLPYGVVMATALPGMEENIIKYGKNFNAIIRQATNLNGDELSLFERETVFKVCNAMGLFEDDEATRTKGANAIKQGYLEDYKVTRNEDGTETREKVNDGLTFKRFMEVFGRIKMKPYNPNFTKLFLNNSMGVEHISKFVAMPVKEQKKISKIFNNFDRIATDYEAYKTTAKGDKEFDFFEYCFNYKDISKFGEVPEDRVELAEKIAPYYNTEKDFQEVCEIVDKHIAPYICLPEEVVTTDKLQYVAANLIEGGQTTYEIDANFIEANAKNNEVVDKVRDMLLDKTEGEFTYEWVPKTLLEGEEGNQAYVGNVDNLTVSSIIGTCCTLERVGRPILYNTAWAHNVQMLLLYQDGFPIGKATFILNRETGEGLYNNFEASSNVYFSKPQQEELYNTFYRGTLAMVNTFNEFHDVEMTKVNIGTRANKMDLLQFSKNASDDEWVNAEAVQIPGYQGDAMGQQIVVYNKDHVEKGLKYRNGALVK